MYGHTKLKHVDPDFEQPYRFTICTRLSSMHLSLLTSLYMNKNPHDLNLKVHIDTTEACFKHDISFHLDKDFQKLHRHIQACQSHPPSHNKLSSGKKLLRTLHQKCCILGRTGVRGLPCHACLQHCRSCCCCHLLRRRGGFQELL